MTRRFAVRTLHIKIKDDSKIPFLLGLLKELPFVEVDESTTLSGKATTKHGKASVEDLFGIWAHSDVTLKKIRQKAWDRNKHDSD